MLKRLTTKNANESDEQSEAPVTSLMIKRQYERPPSFTDLLPWVEYNPDSQSFLLEDGISLGALFELTPVGTEARTHKFMDQLRNAIQIALTDAIPEEDEAPWILQVYVQDEPSLKGFQQNVADYAQPAVRTTEYTQNFQKIFSQHLDQITRPGGLFEDTSVTGSPWRGQVRRVRAVLYRRLKPKGKLPPAIEVEEELNDVATKWIASLASGGIRARRGEGKDLYEWLLKWFNPAPEITQGDPDKLLELAPYPGDEDLPFGYDLAERLTLTMPRSDNDTATWWFDDLPHTIVTIQGLRRAPEVGHRSEEHTSELQSHSFISYAVFCLKKKIKINDI